MSETYGEKIQRLRTARGWTQDQLAEESGVPRRTLQDIELDKVKKPQRSTRLALARVLEIEGNAEQERAEWPDDVTKILDILGAFLMTKTPEQRLDWLRDVTVREWGEQGPARLTRD